MAGNFVLIALVVTCILLETTYAASFECAENDEPAACKTYFATQFENGFKNLHVATIPKFITTYTEIGNIIKSELPAHSPLTNYTDEHISLINKALEKIQGNVGDVKKFSDTLRAAARALSGEFENIAGAEKLSEIAQKYDFFPHRIVNILRKLSADTGDLWAEMYKGLREMDLKTYPEYAEVNVYMENLRDNGGREEDFMQAVEILGTKFNLPYFAELNDIEDV